MSESIYAKKERVRKPQVHVTYEIERGTAVEQKELPFVVGVVADLAGHSTAARGKLKGQDRKFVSIDRDNFDAVLKSIQPRLSLRVDDKLTGGTDQIGVELGFQSMGDFDPVRVIEQVKPLAKLLETRKDLADLSSRIESSDALESHLKAMLADPEIRSKLKSHFESGQTPDEVSSTKKEN